MSPLTRRDRTLALAGPVGAAVYVFTWLVLGEMRRGYDPQQDAISRLFELGAPATHRLALSLALLVTGVALVAFAMLLDRRLPGVGPVGPFLLAMSGVATALVVAFPCSSGCPGMGASFTDTMHVFVAGSGYIALVTAPIAAGVRVRPYWPRVARWSIALGTIAFVGFIVRNSGVDTYGGLQQRFFNTTADAWIAMMGIVLVRQGRGVEDLEPDPVVDDRLAAPG